MRPFSDRGVVDCTDHTRRCKRPPPPCGSAIIHTYTAAVVLVFYTHVPSYTVAFSAIARCTHIDCSPSRVSLPFAYATFSAVRARSSANPERHRDVCTVVTTCPPSPDSISAIHVVVPDRVTQSLLSTIPHTVPVGAAVAVSGVSKVPASTPARDARGGWGVAGFATPETCRSTIATPVSIKTMYAYCTSRIVRMRVARIRGSIVAHLAVGQGNCHQRERRCSHV